MEELELLCIAGGNVKWCSHCGTFGGSQKIKQRITISGYIPKRTESKDSNRYLYTHVLRSIIHSS